MVFQNRTRVDEVTALLHLQRKPPGDRAGLPPGEPDDRILQRLLHVALAGAVLGPARHGPVRLDLRRGSDLRNSFHERTNSDHDPRSSFGNQNPYVEMVT